MTARLHISAANQHLPYTPKNDDIDDKVVPGESRKPCRARLDLSVIAEPARRFWAEAVPTTARALGGRPLTKAEARRGLTSTFALWKWDAGWSDEDIVGVHLNTPKWVGWLIEDVDHDDLFRWKDAGLPAPMFTVVNGDHHPDPAKRGRHHHVWKLADPVLIGPEYAPAPQSYLRAIQLGVADAIGADRVFAARLGGGATKNPLHPAFRVIAWAGARPVALDEFAAVTDLTLASANGNVRPGVYGRALADQPEESRHREVFDGVRWDAYEEVWANWDYYRGEAASPAARTALLALVRGWLDSVNMFGDPLPRYDLEATARSITRFCLHRLRPRKADLRRPGRGKLRETVAGLTLPERQAVGARHSSAAKSAVVRARVETAVASLLAEGLEVSPGAVGARAGCDRKTARRHLADLSIPSAEGGAFGVHQMNGEAEARPCAGRLRPRTPGTSKNIPATAAAVPAGGGTDAEVAMADDDRLPRGTTILPVWDDPPRRVARWRQFDEQADARADDHLQRFRGLRPPGPEDTLADAAVPW